MITITVPVGDGFPPSEFPSLPHAEQSTPVIARVQRSRGIIAACLRRSAAQADRRRPLSANEGEIVG